MSWTSLSRGRMLARLRHVATMTALVASLVLVGFGGWNDSFAQVNDPEGSKDKDSCLASVPVPTPAGMNKRVIQLVNCSKEVLLGAANAAYRPGHEPTSVMPREKTWVMEPVGSPNHKNVLTIDIPTEWENTKCSVKECKAVGPRFWARTGCRYDIEKDIAQCETGGCSGRYDCSRAKQSASVGTSIAEWTIAEPRSNDKTTYLQDAPDISAVDGVNLNIDIQPIGGSSHSPFDEKNNQGKWINHEYEWLAEQYPLTRHGMDLRADSICPASHRWRRSQLVNDKPWKNVYGMVIIDDNGKPATVDARGKIISNGDATIGCWSNCGKMAWPTAPPMDCDASDKHSRCWAWKVLCAGDDRIYGQKCKTDADCKVGASCYDLHDTSPNNLTCQARGYVKKLPCAADVCTYQYGWKDPWMGITHYEFQPPLALCSTYLPDADQCIGEDVMKSVMPKAYTWPNDPQVYVGDSQVYRVIFAPGGTNVPITPAAPVPACQDLPKHYNYAENVKNCAIDINNGAEFAIAFPHSEPLKPGPDFHGAWGCKMDLKGAGDEGVICRWKQKTAE